MSSSVEYSPMREGESNIIKVDLYFISRSLLPIQSRHRKIPCTSEPDAKKKKK